PALFSRIQLENISFSYGLGLPPVLKGVNLSIEPSKTTAIVGPSGSGKTTLLKILCGVLEPTEGRVLVDGIPLREYGTRAYRNQLGVVSQEDTLFAGSLAENIAFFDSDYSMEWIAECCRRASIHEDIMRMPMKYETLVGDMGSNLSGGQKQRILLARALYKKPAMLLLDEGTAHLDVATESRVMGSLNRSGETRVVVAHRPETIRSADKVIRILEGKATEYSGLDSMLASICAEADMEASNSFAPAQ
ncbi:MAG: ATP-binding cassette domain-containing protein, partial [Lysobacter sp.]